MGKVPAMGRKKDKKRRQPNPQQSFCTSVDVDAELQQAISLYQSGKLQQAEQICQHALKDFPRHANALHLLGVIAYQVEEYQIATDLISRAVTIDSDGNTIEIILTAGASCPDVLLDEVIRKIILWFPDNLVFISDIMLP